MPSIFNPISTKTDSPLTAITVPSRPPLSGFPRRRMRLFELGEDVAEGRVWFHAGGFRIVAYCWIGHETLLLLWHNRG